MKIIEVVDKQTQKAFNNMVNLIYKQDKNYIRPLDLDINKVFNPNLNLNIVDNNCKRWVIYDEQSNEYIGRVAAFYKHKPKDRLAEGGIGFFECIDNKDASELLFNIAISWLNAMKINIIDGPINLGERDKFWGLLVDGYSQPSYQENYNPPYYKTLFEDYGFKTYFRQDTMLLKSSTLDTSRISKIYEWLTRRGDYHVEYYQRDKLKKYATDFTTIYNAAWQRFDTFKPITPAQAIKEFKTMAPIVDPKYVPFFYAKDKPVAVCIAIPEINRYFKPLKGKFGWLQKIQFYITIKTQKNDTLRGMVFGVHPDYQNKGLDAALIYREWKSMQENGQYDNFLISWIGGFNDKMQSLMHDVFAETYKVHYTYRLITDNSIPFVEYAIH